MNALVQIFLVGVASFIWLVAILILRYGVLKAQQSSLVSAAVYIAALGLWAAAAILLRRKHYISDSGTVAVWLAFVFNALMLWAFTAI